MFKIIAGMEATFGADSMVGAGSALERSVAAAGTAVDPAVVHSAVGQLAIGGIPGLGELWPILLIVVLLFGGRKLPELARAAGSSITQFKRGLKDEESAESIEGPGPEAAEKEST